MTDTNRPEAWRVIDNETRAVMGEFPLLRDAVALCEQLEPAECIYGYRYTTEPVRHSAVPNGD